MAREAVFGHARRSRSSSTRRKLHAEGSSWRPNGMARGLALRQRRRPPRAREATCRFDRRSKRASELGAACRRPTAVDRRLPLGYEPLVEGDARHRLRAQFRRHLGDGRTRASRRPTSPPARPAGIEVIPTRAARCVWRDREMAPRRRGPRRGVAATSDASRSACGPQWAPTKIWFAVDTLELLLAADADRHGTVSLGGALQDQAIVTVAARSPNTSASAHGPRFRAGWSDFPTLPFTTTQRSLVVQQIQAPTGGGSRGARRREIFAPTPRSVSERFGRCRDARRPGLVGVGGITGSLLLSTDRPPGARASDDRSGRAAPQRVEDDELQRASEGDRTMEDAEDPESAEPIRIETITSSGGDVDRPAVRCLICRS